MNLEQQEAKTDLQRYVQAAVRDSFEKWHISLGKEIDGLIEDGIRKVIEAEGDRKAKFSFEEFKAGKLAVKFPTKQEAEMFFAYLHGKGLVTKPVFINLEDLD
jgi:hypothetical protein